MKKIQMVDLQGQYQQIKETVNTSIEQVLNSSTYINGPLVHEFQSDLEKYLGVKHVIPCANGTDALQIAMMGLGLGYCAGAFWRPIALWCCCRTDQAASRS